MNIHDHVKVVLTQHGAETYNEHYEQFVVSVRPPVKQEGDSLKDSLWKLMQIFGGTKVFLGMRECPFKDCQMDVSSERLL